MNKDTMTFSACTNRVWKPLPGTFDKTPKWLNCFKQLDEHNLCPIHGADINDPSRIKKD